MVSRRILIVEDEALIAMALQVQLEEAGHSVVGVVATGKAAVQAAGELRPDVILMDILLAGQMDGVEAAAQIRERQSVPVVFATGYMDQEVRQRALEQQPLGYVTKPLTIEKIAPILDRLRPEPETQTPLP
jgi:CheY-like chemotaxis protein